MELLSIDSPALMVQHSSFLIKLTRRDTDWSKKVLIKDLSLAQNKVLWKIFTLFIGQKTNRFCLGMFLLMIIQENRHFNLINKFSVKPKIRSLNKIVASCIVLAQPDVAILTGHHQFAWLGPQYFSISVLC